MPSQTKPSEDNEFLAGYLQSILWSLKRLVDREIVEENLSLQEQARQVFYAPYVLVAHNAKDDPVFQYSNQKGLELFEMTWEEFTCLPSRFSAEPENRDERQKLLNEVNSRGFSNNYSGIRISKTGKRFKISNALIWNVIDNKNQKIGQAAMFSEYSYL